MMIVFDIQFIRKNTLHICSFISPLLHLNYILNAHILAYRFQLPGDNSSDFRVIFIDFSQSDNRAFVDPNMSEQLSKVIVAH